MLPPKKRKTYESRDDSGVTIPPQVKTYVNKAIRNAAELKFADFAINGTASTSGTYQVQLNAIGVGTGYNQRIGDKIKLRRIEWDLQVEAGDNFNVTRTIIGACRNSTYPPVPLSALTSGTNPDFGPYLLDRKPLSSTLPLMEVRELKLPKSSLLKEQKHQSYFDVQRRFTGFHELEHLCPVS